MDVLHELSLLMVQARASEAADEHHRTDPDDLLSERIAAVRGVILRDRIAASAVSMPAPPHARLKSHERQSIILHGRRVDLPVVVVQLAQVLAANNERPALARDIAPRLDLCRATVIDRMASLKAALFHANCGLSIHVSREGYSLLATPITLAQRLEATG